MLRRLSALVLTLILLVNTAFAIVIIPDDVITKVNDVVSSLVTEESSAYKRVKVLHDWLINNAEYDLTYTNYDPDGVLLEGNGVCQSYATAYDLLMEAAGVTSRIVCSDEINHAWNLVKLDDEWYHVDTTWDDPVPNGNERDDYFLLSDDDIVGDHINWYDLDFNYFEYLYEDSPAANGNAYDTVDADDYGSEVYVSSFENLKSTIASRAKNGQTNQRIFTCAWDGTDEMYNAMIDWAWYQPHDGFSINSIWSWASMTTMSFEVVWTNVDGYVYFVKSNTFIDIGDKEGVAVADTSSDDLVWTSDNEAIVTVDQNGHFTGKKAGTAYVRATVRGTTAYDELKVTVLSPMKADFDLTFSKSTATLTWNPIRGANKYLVYQKAVGDADFKQIAVQDTTSLTVDLAASSQFTFYVRALRTQDDKIITSFTSDKITCDGLKEKTPLKVAALPEYVAAYEGETAKVTVKAQGDGLTYKWYFKNPTASKFSLTASFTGNTYSVKMDASRDGRQVYCVVTDAYGDSVKTKTVTLSMGTPLMITQQPKSVAVKEGQKAAVTIDAQGDGLTYTWYFKNPGAAKFSKTTSFTGKTYSVQMDESRDGRQVYCVVTDKYGKSVQTNTATLSMQHTAKITAQPKTAWVYEGQTAKATVTATGDGLTYQWYIAKAGSQSFSKSSITASSYGVKMSDANDGRQVFCVVTDQYGNSVKTNTVTLNVAAPFAITRQPASVAVKAGKTAKVSFTATGEGLTYTWYFKNAGAASFSKTTSFTGNSYSVAMDESRSGRQIYCVVKDVTGKTLTTNTVTLSLQNPAKIAAQPKSVWVYDGQTAKTTVTATGDGLTYTWYIAKAGSQSFGKSSITASTYSVKMSDANDGRQVYCVVTDKYGNSVKTNTVTLNVASPFAITKQPASVAVKSGAKATVSFAATGEGLTYTWYYKNPGAASFSKTTSFTGNSYSVTMDESRSGRQIYCVVKDITGKTLTTQTVTLKIK